jgi:hypothetical protein
MARKSQLRRLVVAFDEGPDGQPRTAATPSVLRFWVSEHIIVPMVPAGCPSRVGLRGRGGATLRQMLDGPAQRI